MLGWIARALEGTAWGVALAGTALLVAACFAVNHEIDRCSDNTAPSYIEDDAARAAACD